MFAMLEYFACLVHSLSTYLAIFNAYSGDV